MRNRFRTNSDGSITIFLTRNKKCAIDKTDMWILNRKWCAHINLDGKCYAMSSGEYMHRVITCCPKGKVVDHINGDGLDNRRTNLRVTTYSINCHNESRLRKSNTSGATGIYWNPLNKNWRVKIQVKYKYIEIGSFSTKEKAIRARVLADKKFGVNVVK